MDKQKHVMVPARDAHERGAAVIKAGGVQLLEYDNVYWKSNPMMFRRLYDIVRAWPRNHVQVLSKQPKVRPGCRKTTYPKTWDLHMWINASLPKLTDPKYTMKTKVYWIMNGLTDFPECANLTRGRHTLEGKNVVTSALGYGHHAGQGGLYCCSRCKYEDEKFAGKIAGKLRENFNDPAWRKRWHAKQAATRAEKYGGRWVDPALITNAFMEKYGVTGPAYLPDVREKTKDTVRLRYGRQYDNVFQVPAVKERSRLTSLRKTGYDNCMKDPACREKVRQTALANHGTYSVSYRYVYAGMPFDSGWELCFYEYAADAGADVRYPSGLSIPYDDSGKERHYHPDFVVDGVVVELKGKQFFGPDGVMRCPYRSPGMTDEEHDALNRTFEAKQKCMSENGVKVLTEDDMRPVLEYVERKHGVSSYMEYCRRFRKKVNSVHEEFRQKAERPAREDKCRIHVA